jgi:hypothetical protein
LIGAVLPPHPPATANIITANMVTANIAGHARPRFRRHSMHARAAPPAPHGQVKPAALLADVELAAVVTTVTVAVCDVDPLIVTEAGTVQEGGSVSVDGVIAQLRVTAPVNQNHGATVTVEVLPVVAPALTETGAPGAMEK